MSNEQEEPCDCPLHGAGEVTGFRLEAGNRLTLRAEAIVHTKDKALILAFMGAHRERYEHSPLTTLFLARDWFTMRGCKVEVRPVAEACLFTGVCTSIRLAFREFLWKRLGMALYQGQETCECCAANLRKQAEEAGLTDAEVEIMRTATRVSGKVGEDGRHTFYCPQDENWLGEVVADGVVVIECSVCRGNYLLAKGEIEQGMREGIKSAVPS